MAQPAETRWVKRIALLLALFVPAVLVAAVAVVWLRPAAPLLGPSVSISSPQNGTMTELNRPVRITASATSPTGITRVELYADGALVGVQETTLSDGSNPLMMNKSWAPPTKGRHVLMVRAYARDKQFADSSVAYVDVVDLLSPTARVSLDSIPRGPNVPIPSLQQVSELSGVPVPALQTANPALQGVDPSAPLPSGTTLEIPRSPAPPPSTPSGSPEGRSPSEPPEPPLTPLSGTPGAPLNLNGAGDCASIQLTWADSPDEEHYRVYRIGPGDERALPIATLPRDSVSYRDTFSLPGTYRYQLAAVRGTREGLGVMFTYMTPDACASPAPPAGMTNLVLNWVALETSATYDSVFCYVSINGSAPERVPAYPDNLVPALGTPRTVPWSQLPNRGLVTLPDHPDGEPVGFRLECQGWQGYNSTSLGVISASHPPADWDGADRVADASGFRVRYRIGPDSTPARLRAVPVYWGALSPELLRISLESVSNLPSPYNLRLDLNGRTACDQIRDDHGLDRARCALTGLPTFYWNWDGDNTRIRGFRFYIDGVATHPEIDSAQRALLLPIDVWQRVQTIGCGGDLGFSLRLVRSDGTPDPGSEPAQGFLRMPPCATGAATVQITFQQLVIGGAAGSVRDNDTCIFCTDRRMELMGDLKAIAGTAPGLYDARAWYGEADVLQHDDFFNVIGRGGLFIFLKPWVDTGRIFGACIDVTCVDDPGRTISWAGVPLDSTDALPRTGKNVLTVKVPEGASLTIDVDLEDGPTGLRTVDPFSSMDPFCGGRIELPRRSAREWAAIDEIRTITNDFGEASCQLTLQIKGQTP